MVAVDRIPQPTTDQLLLEAVRDGSLPAFELLVVQYDGPIRAYLTRLTGDAELAKDLAQETFLDLYRSRVNVPVNCSFAAWLFRVARYNALPTQRRAALIRFTSLDWLFEHMHIPALNLRRSDETRLVSERDLIQKVLDELTPILRDALILHTLAGFTGHEVAQVLGISPVAARKRISRAEHHFRRIYRSMTSEVQGNNS